MVLLRLVMPGAAIREARNGKKIPPGFAGGSDQRLNVASSPTIKNNITITF